MENQKIENLLNLALQATPEERRRSFNLSVGYEEERDAWEVIVRYQGGITFLEGGYGIHQLCGNHQDGIVAQ